MNKKNLVLMAIAAGKPVANGNSFPVYTGVMPMKVVAVNPTKKELEALYSRAFDKEPEYLRVDPKTGVKSMRVDFICKTESEKCNGVDMLTRISMWVNDAIQYNADKSKVKVINPYGQTTWLTKDEFKEKRLPDNIPASLFLMEDPRPCLIGEERLMKFVQASVNIPRVVADFATGELIKDKASANCRFDTLKDMISKGNFTELKSIVPAMKLFKMGAGARTTDDNRTYQDWFLDYPMKGGVNDMKYYDAALKKAKANGAYANTNFGNMPYEVKEYVAQPTDLKAIASDIPGAIGIADDVDADW